MTRKETELVQKLSSYDELWIIPCKDKLAVATVAAITKYVKSGRGLWIFGGNLEQPSNQILASIQQGISFSETKVINGKVLVAGKADVKGQFGSHPITTGLNKFDMFQAKC